MAVYWALKGVSTLALVSALAGCVVDPAAPLIPLPERQGTVLPSEAPERGPDGFANVLADPVVVGGLPRPEREITAEENALEAEGRRTAAAASAINTGSSAAALAARGRNHVAETRAAIIAQARPPTDEPPRLLNGNQTPGAVSQPSAGEPTVDPGRPLDPDDPLPRAVGVPPFSGDPVAPDR